MNYSIDINADYTDKVELGGDLYYSKDFTLTVNAVNDASIVCSSLSQKELQLWCSIQQQGFLK